jgi:hypothetical protein
MKNVGRFIFALKYTTTGGGITNIASLLFLWRYTKKGRYEKVRSYIPKAHQKHIYELECVSNNLFTPPVNS